MSTEQETPTQRQARLRRERREAKLKTEGTSRLEKITNLSGRENLPDAPAPALGQPSNQQSDGGRSTSNTAPQVGEADLRAMLQAAEPQQGHEGEQAEGLPDDPIQQMLSQLMGGVDAGPPGAESGGLGPPPDLAALMGTFGTQAQTPGQVREAARDDYIWKIIHSLFALALGIYVILSTAAMNGPIAAHTTGGTADRTAEDRINLFWAFATVELGLQSVRYFLERGKTTSQVGGWLGTLSTIVPEPARTYLRLIARYSGIWSTLVEDGSVLIFMIGLASWKQGISR